MLPFHQPSGEDADEVEPGLGRQDWERQEDVACWNHLEQLDQRSDEAR